MTAISDIIKKESVKEDIDWVMESLGIERMPTSSEVRSILPSLCSRISKSGGYVHWAKRLGLEMKSNYTRKTKTTSSRKWTYEEIEKSIYSVANSLGIKRMPTYHDIISEEGNSLSNAIVRTLGYKGWAERLKLSIKESETSFGQSTEDMVEKLLNKQGFHTYQMGTIAPYDILVNQNIRIDVKSATLRGNSHTYALGSKPHCCDIYICVGFDENRNDIMDILIIPFTEAKTQTITVRNRKGKYMKFKDRWGLISEFSTFFKKLVNK